MSKFLKKSFFFKRFYSELVEKYGQNKANDIWDHAEAEYCRLKSAEPSADKNSISFVFPAVAPYRSIEKICPGEALSVTRDYGKKTGVWIRTIFKRITSLPGMPALIWKKMDVIAAKMSSGYEIKNLGYFRFYG